MSTLINTRQLIQLASRHQWGEFCKYYLLVVLGRTNEPFRTAVRDEDVASLPETIDYALFRCTRFGESLGVSHLLDVATCREGINSLMATGTLLLAMAREFFVPRIPQDFAGYHETQRLLGVVQAYLEGRENAEAYIRAAQHYRSHFIPSYHMLGKVPGYEYLYEAMPCQPLDHVIALEGWGLYSAWEGFGRFLAWETPEICTLEAVLDSIDDTIFVEDDSDLNADAMVSAQCMIDELMEVYRADALEPFADELVALIDRVLGYAPDSSEAEQGA